MIHLIKLFPIATHSYSQREMNDINDHSESNSVCKNAKLFCVCHNKQKSIENYENFFRFKLLLLLQNILAENIKITCSQEFMKCFFTRKLQEKKKDMELLRDLKLSVKSLEKKLAWAFVAEKKQVQNI